ncbi:MAG: hypothetical protein NT061_00085 [Spirochaetes bacterium]|nr:hypothetical protein [Spirochaetota bacterium]
MAAAGITILYTLIALPRLGNDSRLRSLGTLRLPEPRELKEPLRQSEADWGYFSNLENLGFYSPREVVEACYRLNPQAAFDGNSLVDPHPERDLIDLYKLREGRKIQLPFTGYPFLGGSRIFIVRPDQQAVSEINGEGRTIWSREFGSTLTSASATAGHSVWGTLGGDILIQYAPDNFKEILPESLGLDSAQACIYATAISIDGATAAVLYGLDPQYALFFVDKGIGYSLVHKQKLAESTTRAQGAVFSEDGAYAVMGTEAGLLVYDVKERTSNLIHAERFGGGEVESHMEAWGKDSVAILSSVNGEKYLSIIRNGIMEACFKVDDDATGLSIQSSDSLVVSGSRFLRRYGMKGKAE